MVGVKNDDEFARRMVQSIVEIAGLGVFVAGAGAIAHIEVGAKPLQISVSLLRPCRRFDVVRIAFLVRAPVVEQKDRNFISGIFDGFDRGERSRQKIAILVVARHKYVDGRQLFVRQMRSAARGQRHGDDE